MFGEMGTFVPVLSFAVGNALCQLFVAPAAGVGCWPQS